MILHEPTAYLLTDSLALHEAPISGIHITKQLRDHAPGIDKARPDQFRGSPAEQLIEYAARVCYDSIGKAHSRPTIAHLHHLADVKHYSVFRHVHGTMTFNIHGNLPLEALAAFQLFSRIPGMQVDFATAATRPNIPHQTSQAIFVFNMNHVLEIGRHIRQLQLMLDRRGCPPYFKTICAKVFHHLYQAFDEWLVYMAPIVQRRPDSVEEYNLLEEVNLWNHTHESVPPPAPYSFSWTYGGIDIDYPFPEDAIWVSFYVKCSRACANELIRHSSQSVVSQRSTRYVRETQNTDDGCPDLIVPAFHSTLDAEANRVMHFCGDAYDRSIAAANAGNFDERKKAYGAARNLLPMGLVTKLVFTASVSQLKHLINQRMSGHADAEIALLASRMLNNLKFSPSASFVTRSFFDGSYFESDPREDYEKTGKAALKFDADRVVGF